MQHLQHHPEKVQRPVDAAEQLHATQYAAGMAGVCTAVLGTRVPWAAVHSTAHSTAQHSTAQRPAPYSPDGTRVGDCEHGLVAASSLTRLLGTLLPPPVEVQGKACCGHP